jgi:hypothetical protein
MTASEAINKTAIIISYKSNESLLSERETWEKVRIVLVVPLADMFLVHSGVLEFVEETL